MPKALASEGVSGPEGRHIADHRSSVQLPWGVAADSAGSIDADDLVPALKKIGLDDLIAMGRVSRWLRRATLDDALWERHAAALSLPPSDDRQTVDRQTVRERCIRAWLTNLNMQAGRFRKETLRFAERCCSAKFDETGRTLRLELVNQQASSTQLKLISCDDGSTTSFAEVPGLAWSQKLSPNGSRLFSVTRDGFLCVSDREHPQKRSTFDLTGLKLWDFWSWSDAGRNGVLDPINQRLIWAIPHHRIVKIIGIGRTAKVAKFSAYVQDLACALSPDAGKIVGQGVRDGQIDHNSLKVYDVQEGRTVQTVVLEGSWRGSAFHVWSADSASMYVSGQCDGLYRLGRYNAGDGAETMRVAFARRVQEVALACEDARALVQSAPLARADLVGGLHEVQLSLLETRSGRTLSSVMVHAPIDVEDDTAVDEPLDIQYNPQMTRLICAQGPSKCLIYDLMDGRQICFDQPAVDEGRMAYSWSPDGSSVALHGDGFLAIRDAAGGAETARLVDQPTEWVSCIRWRMDSNIMLWSSSAGIKIWDTGRKTELLKLSEKGMRSDRVRAQWSPDGSQLVFYGAICSTQLSTEVHWVSFGPPRRPPR